MHKNLNPQFVKTALYDTLNLPTSRGSLARNVLFISEMYAGAAAKFNDIWRREELAIAYFSYYMPLNWLRALSVIAEGTRLGFFADLEEVVEFGSGPGTFHFAALESRLHFAKWHFVEHEVAAQEWHERFLAALPELPAHELEWSRKYSGEDHAQKKTLGVFSYSLNEVAALPSWATHLEALCIIEPSTAEAGRRLQELRQTLINAGYNVWAPCTHRGPCPLLLHSKTDWCHQRIHVELPPKVSELENHLPIKNATLTYSYLLARRKPQAEHAALARVIGDTLYERGKVRQSVCRGPEREFLSWLTRFGEPEPIARGTLLEIPANAELKGNEIRLPRSDSTN